ncbi:MAG: hypothetical protein XD36_0967 [Halomonas sp. 54_146]|nr:MAG: hypothetical protein XD36_0967 [Halomonas sp. 54_146]
MRRLGIRGVVRVQRPFTTISDPDQQRAPDLVNVTLRPCVLIIFGWPILPMSLPGLASFTLRSLSMFMHVVKGTDTDSHSEAYWQSYLDAVAWYLAGQPVDHQHEQPYLPGTLTCDAWAYGRVNGLAFAKMPVSQLDRLPNKPVKGRSADIRCRRLWLPSGGRSRHGWFTGSISLQHESHSRTVAAYSLRPA